MTVEFVATQGNNVRSSPDGETWTHRLTGSGFGFNKVEHAPDLQQWLALNFFVVYPSDDGETWGDFEVITTDGSAMWGLDRSPELGLWLTAGENGRALTSPDGINWTSRSPGFGSGFTFNEVIWAPGHSRFYLSDDSTGRLSSTPDGITFTSEGTSLLPWLGKMAYSSSLDTLLAVGDSDDVITKTGPTGTITTTDTGLGVGGFNAATWSPEVGLFLIGGDEKLATSPDGTTWTQQTTTFGSSIVLDTDWNATLGLFVASAQHGKLATSPDGVNWTAQSPGFGTSSIANVASRKVPSVTGGLTVGFLQMGGA